MTKNTVVLLACGDVGPVHEPMDIYGALARSTLDTGHIRFAQCERVYAERGSLQVHSTGYGTSPLKPHMASVFEDCGFNVASLASNHTMDWGADALLDTIAMFRKRGIQTVGAGRDIEEARKPAIFDCNGVKVAILAYCSILHEGYAAAPRRPGIAPLRVHTYYEPMEYQPGMPPCVVTVPYADDLEGMLVDIREAKKAADIVVVSHHWGLHFLPRSIADYQPIVAKAAFDAGADLILGHHPHVPKAIGVHSGKVCFYSLSNFIMTSHHNSLETMTPKQVKAFEKRYGVTVDPDYTNMVYGSDGKRSLIAKATFSRGGVQEVAFLPVLIDKQLRPEVLHAGDERFDDAVRFMDWASEDFDHKFTVRGDEVVVTGA